MSTQQQLIKIRDLIIRDPCALDKWSGVVDHLVESVSDARKIKGLFEKHEYGEAALQSINIWWAKGVERADLLGLLRQFELNRLAGQIRDYVNILASETDRLAKCEAWFGIGEVVYNFTGRQAELNAIRNMLFGARDVESSIVNTVCIRGLGGIGKSALARKYAFTYRSEYDGNVMWINAETEDSLRVSFTGLAKHLGLSIKKQTCNVGLTSAVYSLFKDKKCLFIFDNVESRQHFQHFKPTNMNPDDISGLHILITTRIKNFPSLGNQLNLNILSLVEAVELIQNHEHMPEATTEMAANLAENLQRLPLALQQALAYICDKYADRNANRNISRYLKEFKNHGRRLLNYRGFLEHNQYSQTTFTTWQVSFQRIKRIWPGSSKLINTMAYLNPDYISVQLLKKLVQFQENLKSSLVPRALRTFLQPTMYGAVEQTLKLLERFSMITLQNEHVEIHRLVQQVIRSSLGAKEQRVIKIIIKYLQAELQKTHFNNTAQECVSHALHVFQFQSRYTALMRSRADYLSQLCYYTIEYGNYAASYSIAQRSSFLFEQINGKEHESTLQMKWRSSDAQFWLGNYAESLQTLQWILSASKHSLGQEHWLTLHTLFSIGRAHFGMGDYQKAIGIYNQVIELRIQLCGEDDSELLTYKHKKGYALSKLGKLDEALQEYQFVHERRIKLFGGNDLRTLQVKRGLANVAALKGELAAALQMYQDVYEGYRLVRGDTNSETIDLRRNVEELRTRITAEAK